MKANFRLYYNFIRRMTHEPTEPRRSTTKRAPGRPRISLLPPESQEQTLAKSHPSASGPTNWSLSSYSLPPCFIRLLKSCCMYVIQASSGLHFPFFHYVVCNINITKRREKRKDNERKEKKYHGWNSIKKGSPK